jgi:hypothetical protein
MHMLGSFTTKFTHQESGIVCFLIAYQSARAVATLGLEELRSGSGGCQNFEFSSLDCELKKLVGPPQPFQASHE